MKAVTNATKNDFQPRTPVAIRRWLPSRFQQAIYLLTKPVHLLILNAVILIRVSICCYIEIVAVEERCHALLYGYGHI